MNYLESLIIESTKDSIRLRSPAKINLYLRVLDERPDGYHNLQNLMQVISFFDEIEIQLDDEAIVTARCDDPEVPQGDDNIAVRAAESLIEECGIQRGANITIVKNIPMGAGLGGGSSNAGTVLLGLNRLLGCPADMALLQKVAIGLGSDVPFFLHGGMAMCTGKGEVIEPFEPLPEFWVVIVYPNLIVSTGSIYNIYKKKCLTLNRRGANLLDTDIVKGLYSSALASVLHNDLEVIVEEVVPEIRIIKEELKASGCEHVMVTGSGSSLFGLCKSRDQSASVSSGLQELLKDERYLIVEASNRL